MESARDLLSEIGSFLTMVDKKTHCATRSKSLKDYSQVFFHRHVLQKVMGVFPPLLIFFFPAILLRAELHISWHRPQDLNAWNRLTLFSKIQLVLLLRILGGGVPPGSPNPDPISDQKM